MSAFVPSGLTFKTPREIALKIKEMGFNCVRLNWSLELFLDNPILHTESYTAIKEAGILSNPFVRALQVFDLCVQALAAEKIMIILDNHMSDGGWCCDPRDGNGLWFNERYSVRDFERAWVGIVSRYRHLKYVIGADLRNEIRPDIQIDGTFDWIFYPRIKLNVPTWGTGDGEMKLKHFSPEIYNYSPPDITDGRHDTMLLALREIVGRTKVKFFDWHAVATRVGNMIQKANRNVLVIVGGLFDFHAYNPNVLQIMFYYLKYDPELYSSIGKYFDIPDAITKYSQLHNLTGVATLPINLDEPNRLVYTVHLYEFFYLGAQFAWNDTEPSYQNYSTEIDKYWGYIYKQELAPVWVGETGSRNDASGIGPSWTGYVLRYIGENDLDFCYWPLGDQKPNIDRKTGNFSAGYDEYGLLNHNYSAVLYPPLLESFAHLFKAKSGPGVSPPLYVQD